jgi:hypothetical protein
MIEAYFGINIAIAILYFCYLLVKKNLDVDGFAMCVLLVFFGIPMFIAFIITEKTKWL